MRRSAAGTLVGRPASSIRSGPTWSPSTTSPSSPSGFAASASGCRASTATSTSRRGPTGWRSSPATRPRCPRGWPTASELLGRRAHDRAHEHRDDARRRRRRRLRGADGGAELQGPDRHAPPARAARASTRCPTPRRSSSGSSPRWRSTPDWLDMDLVEEGARHERIPQALLAPYVIRGAFVATFLNTYAALPMALTGALGGRKAARRVNETASFFAVTTMPGALERHGPGFEAAAMVRLMHSMVRFNALKKLGQVGPRRLRHPDPPGRPDAGRADQRLPAGPPGRRTAAAPEFNARERAIVEFSRYRCFLLGPARGAAARHARGDHPRDARPRRDAARRTSTTRSAASWCARRCPPTSSPRAHCPTAWPTPSRRATASSSSSAPSSTATASRAPRWASTMGLEDYARFALTAPLVFGSFWTASTASRLPIVGGAHRHGRHRGAQAAPGELRHARSSRPTTRSTRRWPAARPAAA